MSDFEKALATEIQRLKDQLSRLVGMSATPVKRRGRKPGSKNKPQPAKKHRRVSAQVRAQRVLQGQYMGHVRRLTAEQKKKVAEIREKSGYRKAIAEAKRLAR
jgi:hypothetical protein